MKRSLVVVLVTLLSFMMLAVAFAATPGTMDLKVGDEAYVCNCGPGCPCSTMAKKEGKCTCGNQMVKAKVVKVEKDMATMQAEGWDKPRAFKTAGKYMCNCGPSCNCGTISQNPGKCVCGNDMKAVI
ncbi:MAG: hypothetical protein M0P73_01225 [Syntrophobacterales bacterium]|nr:hypothetical protein [Syntrophobacterales bacterium]